MLVREVRWGLVNRGSILIRLFYVAVTIYFLVGVLAFTSNAQDYETMWAWFSTQCVLTIVVAPALTANAVTKELELGNLDMLRITLLRPRDIVKGKFLAAAFSLLPVLLAAAVSMIPVGILIRPDWRIVAMGFGTLGICALLSLSIAIFFSTVLRRTLPAIVSSYAASALLFFALPELLTWIQRVTNIWSVQRDRHPTMSPWQTIERFDLFSPFRTLMTTLNHFNGLGAGGALRYWATGSSFWAAFALALLAASVWLFSRNRMRDR
jgi:ABC-type transport system involved in multi-copper enzyme maturation permease subunit